MLNNRKIRLMTQLAIYEKREGKEDIKLSKYYQSDYARFNVLKTAVAVTVSYVFILALIAVYKLEYLIDNALVLDWAGLGKKVLWVYVGVISVYLVLTFMGYTIKYRMSRKKLSKYYRMLRKLKEIYRSEDEYAAGEDLGEEEEDYTGGEE